MITIPTSKNASLNNILKEQNLDIVLIAAPIHSITASNIKDGKNSSIFKPAAGIFYLKGMLNKHNFSSLCLELNLHLEQHFEHSMKHPHKVYKSLINESYTSITTVTKEKITELAKKLNMHEKVIPFLKQYINKKVKFHNPKFVGISVFSIHSQKITIALCTLLREQLPETTIILGGCGLGNEISDERTFGKALLKCNLADFYISGDGEISLIELLKGNTSYNGITTRESIDFTNVDFRRNFSYNEIDDLNILPHPDWSDLIYKNCDISYDKDNNLLVNEKKLSIPINGSRGCVRNCSFCDIRSHWHKFRFRTGKNIANEIVEINKRHDITKFHFTDSLINGSMLAFRDLCVVMAEYHANPNNKKIAWSGQFICRSPRQQTLDDYKLMKAANLDYVVIGVESGSESVRNHMGKKFTNKDLYFNIENLAKNNIKMVLLLMIGYPTETEKDFYDTLIFLEKYKHLVPDHIISIDGGTTTWVVENTPLHDMNVWEGNISKWTSTIVEGLTLTVRQERQKILDRTIEGLGGDRFFRSVRNQENAN